MSRVVVPGGAQPWGAGQVGGGGPLSIKERRRRNPSRLSNVLIAAAVRALPPVHRERYTREFYAELYGLSRSRQVVYAGALVLHSTHLALALGDTEPVEAGAGTARDWRCRMRRHHDVIRNNPAAETRESAFYKQCTRCGRIVDSNASGYRLPFLPY